MAGPGEDKPKIVVYLGRRGHGGPRVARRHLLLDGYCRRYAVYRIHVRFRHAAEELSGVGGKAFGKAALALGVESVENERRFAGAGDSRDHDKLPSRDVKRQILEIVDSGAAYFYVFFCQRSMCKRANIRRSREQCKLACNCRGAAV